jgi:GNAT superfamily N-acetyltransferase
MHPVGLEVRSKYKLKTMYTLIRTDCYHPDFKTLVVELDKDLAIRDGEEHSFFAQFNHITDIKYVVVAYDEDVAVGCGAIKQYDAHTMEVKRMFVVPEKRGKGIASLILQALERWTLELGFSTCILETGIKQTEAIQLYPKNNYSIIPNYGQYVGVESSVCFSKKLKF